MPDQTSNTKGNPSLLRQLFEGGAFLPSPGGAYTTIKKIGKQITSNIASNIEPRGYTDGRSTAKSKTMQDIENTIASAKKFTKAGVLNEMSPYRMATENYVSANKDVDENKERLDLVNMWAGKPQRFGTVVKSEYKPTIGAEEGTQYYKLPGVEKELFASLMRNGVMEGKFNKPVKSKQDLENALGIEKGGFFTEAKDASGKKIGYTGTIRSLGEGTISVGEDAKGPYISYYDKWDINPLAGASSAMPSWVPNVVVKGIDKVVTGIPEKMGITSAPRVYGRIYFDKQTGKPIGKDFEDIFNKLKSESQGPEQPIEDGKQSSSSTGGFAGLLKKKSSGPIGKKK
jgi:hypothetical protein